MRNFLSVLALSAQTLFGCAEKTHRVEGLLALSGDEALLVVVDTTKPDIGRLILAGPDGPRWSQPEPDAELLTNQFLAGPHVAADAERVYSLAPGHEKTRLRARSRADGKPVWEASLPGGLARPDQNLMRALVVDGATLFVAMQPVTPLFESHGLLVAFDAATGQERWRIERDVMLFGEAHVGRDVVVVAMGVDWLWIDKARGEVVKSARMEGMGCRVGDVLLGDRGADLVIWSFDPAAPERVVGKSMHIRSCTARGADVIVFGHGAVAAVDPVAGSVRWRTDVRSESPLGLLALHEGEVDVLHLATKSSTGRGASTLDLATGTLTPRRAGELGGVQLGGVSILTETFELLGPTEPPETIRTMVFDAAGQPKVGLAVPPSIVLRLGPWNAANGRLWLVRHGPFAEPDDAVWAVLDLASGELAMEHGSHDVEVLTAAERDAWLAGQPHE